MNNEVTGAVDAQRFAGLLRSLDAENPKPQTYDEMNSLISKMELDECTAGELRRCIGALRVESTPPSKRRSLIEDMLKLLGESCG